MPKVRLLGKVYMPTSVPIDGLCCGSVFAIGYNLYVKTNLVEKDGNIRGVNLETGHVVYLSPNTSVVNVEVEIKMVGAVELE